MLLETRIDEKQASLIEGIQNAVQKLSSVNQSLILLTKLENQEYPVKEKMDFSHFLTRAIESFRELIDMKSLELKTQLEPDIFLSLNPVLADILLTNLLSNAIRHNRINGSIEVLLTSSGLSVRNTGDAPKGDTSELFKRFKKDKQSSDSTGLGLAIVKQICDLNNFPVSYEFKGGHHELRIDFLPHK